MTSVTLATQEKLWESLCDVRGLCVEEIWKSYSCVWYADGSTIKDIMPIRQAGGCDGPTGHFTTMCLKKEICIPNPSSFDRSPLEANSTDLAAMFVKWSCLSMPSLVVYQKNTKLHEIAQILCNDTNTPQEDVVKAGAAALLCPYNGSTRMTSTDCATSLA